MGAWGKTDEHLVIGIKNAHTLTTGTEQYLRVVDGYVCDSAVSVRHGFNVGPRVTLSALQVCLEVVATNPAPIFRIYSGVYTGTLTKIWDSSDDYPAQALPAAGTPFRYEMDVEVEGGTPLVITCEDDGANQVSAFSWALLGR